jgi:capsular polysaccharide biosynthesis protein
VWTSRLADQAKLKQIISEKGGQGQMELKQYLQIIVKKLWIVLAIPLLCASISAYVSFYVLDPVYEADTSLYVINKKMDPQASLVQGDLMVGQLLVKDYRELIKSRTVTSAVISELKLEGVSEQSLAAKISVSAKNDTRIIEIRVQDGQPERAREIADRVATVFIGKVVDLMKVENVSIVDHAQMPVDPVKPKPVINIAIAFVTGLMLAVGSVFLMEYLDDTVKTTEDVEKRIGLVVLGTIPELSLR